MRRKLTYVTIADMCKQHTELNVLVCCSSRVRKRTIYDGLEDHRWVSCTPAEQSYPYFVTSVLKNFRASNFHHCRPPTKYF